MSRFDRREFLKSLAALPAFLGLGAAAGAVAKKPEGMSAEKIRAARRILEESEAQPPYSVAYIPHDDFPLDPLIEYRSAIAQAFARNLDQQILRAFNRGVRRSGPAARF